jgi:selenocysteine lyase/cysteine desulfurase
MSAQYDSKSHIKVRDLFPKTIEGYFDFCSIAIPTRFATKLSDAVANRYFMKDVNTDEFRSWQQKISEDTRKEIADYFGTNPKNISYGNNTTDCIDVAMHLLQVKPNDEVILTEAEYEPTKYVFRYAIPAYVNNIIRVLKEIKNGIKSLSLRQLYEMGLTIQNYGLLSGSLTPRSLGWHLEVLNAERVKEAYNTPLKTTTVSLGKDDEEFLKILENTITNKTKVLYISHITRTNGRILPIEKVGELARKHSNKSNRIYTLIDGAMAPGNINPKRLQLDKMGIDFYATCGHKLLLGEPATGILYIKPEHLDLIENLSKSSYQPLMKEFQFHPDLGMDSKVKGEVEKLKSKLRKLPLNSLLNMIELPYVYPAAFVQTDVERTYLYDFMPLVYWLSHISSFRISMPEIASLKYSLKLLTDFGWDKLENNQRKLRNIVVGGLEKIPNVNIHSPFDESGSPAILSFSFKGADSRELQEKLEKQGIKLSHIDNPESLRVSFSLPTNEEDVTKLLKKLNESL